MKMSSTVVSGVAFSVRHELATQRGARRATSAVERTTPVVKRAERRGSSSKGYLLPFELQQVRRVEEEREGERERDPSQARERIRPRPASAPRVREGKKSELTGRNGE